MLERLGERARRRAEARAEARAGDIGQAIRSALPRGVEVRREGNRIVLAGRGLRSRFIREAGLRWLGRLR